MRMDLNNYEAYFLDYREGNLDEAQVRELFAFLEQHPWLKEELDSYEELVLEEELVFENKQDLKKIEFSDDSLIAYTEGLMGERERAELEGLVSQNAALRKELGLYERARVAPDRSVKFPRKARLKRGGVVIYLRANPVYLRAAAALLLLAGLFFLMTEVVFTGQSDSVQPVLANTNKKAQPAPDNKQAEAKNTVVWPEANNKSLAANPADALATTGAAKMQGSPSKKNVKQPGADQQVSPEPNNEALIVENNTPPGPLQGDPVVIGVSGDNIVTHKSYINQRSDEDEDEKPVVVASAAPAKKTFFDKLTDAARKVNAMGVKKVNADEDAGKKSIMIGGLVVSESYTN
jgi:hypothetical protein